jgi:hypothetical protein
LKEQDKDYQSSSSADESSSTSTGEEFNPSDMPESSDPSEPSKTHAVPIGRPVSDEEYRKMKERAAKDNPPSGGHTQEDPSHRERDGEKETRNAYN